MDTSSFLAPVQPLPAAGSPATAEATSAAAKAAKPASQTAAPTAGCDVR